MYQGSVWLSLCVLMPLCAHICQCLCLCARVSLCPRIIVCLACLCLCLCMCTCVPVFPHQCVPGLCVPVSMCTCVCVCSCLRVPTSACAHVCVQLHPCVPASAYAWSFCACVCVYLLLCVPVPVNAHMCWCLCLWCRYQCLPACMSEHTCTAAPSGTFFGSLNPASFPHPIPGMWLVLRSRWPCREGAASPHQGSMHTGSQQLVLGCPWGNPNRPEEGQEAGAWWWWSLGRVEPARNLASHQPGGRKTGGQG